MAQPFVFGSPHPESQEKVSQGYTDAERSRDSLTKMEARINVWLETFKREILAILANNAPGPRVTKEEVLPPPGSAKTVDKTLLRAKKQEETTRQAKGVNGPGKKGPGPKGQKQPVEGQKAGQKKGPKKGGET